jgi:hypothetical protein
VWLVNVVNHVVQRVCFGVPITPTSRPPSDTRTPHGVCSKSSTTSTSLFERQRGDGPPSPIHVVRIGTTQNVVIGLTFIGSSLRVQPEYVSSYISPKSFP